MIDRRSLVEVGVAMVLRDRFSNEAGRISNSFSYALLRALRRSATSPSGTLPVPRARVRCCAGAVRSHSG